MTNTSRERTTPWLPFGDAPTSTPRLFCFPNAGAGAATFTNWRRMAPDGIEVCPMQPPGRAERYQEDAHQTLDGLLDDMMASLAPRFTGRYALYGHSMGALVVFALTRRLLAEGHPPPAALFVSGRAAPQLANVRRQLYDLPTDELIPELRAIGGTPEEVLGELSLLELFLPTLRADFAVNENYHHTPADPLPVPLTVFGGSDDIRADEDELRAWSELTSAAFDVHVYPGDHFFIVPHAADLLARMAAVLLR
jgi:medium-chain acyl-[acyl-carrier-protein] hydrolase